MNEKSLYGLSLFCFLTGLFLILLINEKLKISESNISSLDSSFVGEKVNIKGFVHNPKNLENLIIFTLKDKTGNITVIAFNSENIELKPKDILEVEGELVLYKDKLEIEASKIKIF